MKKLQWKTRFNTQFKEEVDFLDTLLESYGITDIKSFVHPVRSELNDPFLMKNMDKAVELVHDKLKEDCKILIYVDGDCDGAMASSALTQILKYIKPNVKLDYTYAFQKDHGLTMSKLANFTKDEFGLIIIPDASMEAKDAIEITRNFSAPILVLDHHLVSSETQDTWTGEWMDREKAISIYKENPSEYKTRFHTDCYVNYCLPVNSTDGQYPCTAICGTGVVMKFAEAYCEKYNVDTEILDNIMELVSLAEIADGMDSMKLEARWYMLEGLKEFYWHNDFIKELCDRLADEMPYGRTISSMGWTIAPKINGVFRYGTEEEIVNMCRAIRGEQETIIYKPRRKSKNDPVPEPEEHTLQWDMARTCCNVKSRQDTAVRSFMEKVEEIIKKTEANKRSILFVDCTSVIDKKTVSGLVARKLATKYCRPVVLMRDFTSTEYGGSMRNYSQGNVDDLKSLLEKAGVVCKRHSNAAGIHIEKSKLSEIQAKCDELLPIDSLVTIHQVDWQVDLADLKKEYISEVAENYAIWGNTVPSPTFAITGIRVNASQITRSGPNGAKTFIRFKANNISFVKKYCAAGEFDTMTMKDRVGFGVSKKNLLMNVIGEFQYEKYEDKNYPVVKILYYDVEEDLEANEADKQKMAGGDWSEIEESTSKNKKAVAKNATSVAQKEEKKIDADEYRDDFYF